MRKMSILVLALGMAGTLAFAQVPLQLLGENAPAVAASRTVVIDQNTRYVNVRQGETVKFVSNGQEFAFHFDGSGATRLDLQRIAPPGVLDHTVMVYADHTPEDNDN